MFDYLECIGGGVEALVYRKDAQTVLIRATPSKAFILDFFCETCNPYFPRTRKISYLVYEQELLCDSYSASEDIYTLMKMSQTYTPTYKMLAHNLGLKNQGIVKAMSELFAYIYDARYRLDIWEEGYGYFPNVMERNDGHIVFVDPVISLKMKSGEFEDNKFVLPYEEYNNV